MRILVFILAITACLSSSPIYAQKHIEAEILDGVYLDPVPFAAIRSIPENRIYFADFGGHVRIPVKSDITSLEFSAPFHKSQRIELIDSICELNITLVRKSFFLGEKHSSIIAIEEIRKIKDNIDRLNIEKYQNIEFDLIERFRIISPDIRRFKRKANPYFSLFGKSIKTYNKNHYVFSRAKSISHRQWYPNNKELEINWIYSSGELSEKQILLERELNQIDIEDDYFDINGIHYPNPLAGNPLKRYNFSIADTVGSYVIIQFSPGIFTKANKLKGFIYSDTVEHRIYRILMYNSVNQRMDLKIALVFNSEDEIQGYASKHSNYSLPIFSSQYDALDLRSDIFYNYKRLDNQKSPENADEFILEYPENFKNDSIDELIESDSLESNTKEFYRLNPKINDLTAAVDMNQNISEGYLSIGYFNLQIEDFLNYNKYERFRPGIGFESNEKLFEKVSFGSYIGYGFGDERLKNSHHIQWKYGRRPSNFIKVFAGNELVESGRDDFSQELSPMFNSQNLRKYRLSILDRMRNVGMEHHFSLWKNIRAFFGMESMEYRPTYDNSFQNSRKTIFRYNEISAGLRIAPGEEFASIREREYLLSEDKPVLILEYIRGFRLFDDEPEYDKILLRVKYQKWILGYGKSSIQVDYGSVNHSLPYHKMFVINGGRVNGSVVFHNSFETMRYNEFLADSYLALFYSHDFGGIYLPFLKHFPRLEMLHNFGYGTLRSPQDHIGIEFKEMDRIYMESGMAINRIVPFNFISDKSGLGFGFFYRYGAYQNSNFSENVVLKMALDLKI